MALSSALNTTYKPSSVNVTQKYTPLLDLNATNADSVAVRNMAQNRIDAFTNLGVRVNRLTYLSAESITTYARREAGKSSPLAVISSNRSRWIKERYENAAGILDGITPAVTNFTSVMDTRALSAGATPFYLPIRMSNLEAAARNVYIFVAHDEYNQYKRELNGTGITVIGWRTDGEEQLSGFGASRYAALEFFKYINRSNGASTSVWMLDDNVAYIRSFPGLAAVEGQLGALFGLGFRGGTQAHTDPVFTAISQNAQPAPVAPGAHAQAPILQQAVLWNVALFNANSYSFSPYFITSAEDTSLTKFLGAANCEYYNGCEVLKGLATLDNTIGVRALQGSKRQLLDYCYRIKNDVPFACGAVPAANTLDQVIVAARSAATSPPRITDVATEESVAQTYSKALEQTLTAALANNVALPAATFNPGPLQITSKLTPAI